MEHKKIVHWLLALVSVLMIISGYGITEFRMIENLTFGVLTKSSAFQIHGLLAIPFVLLLLLHIFFHRDKS